MSSFDFIFEEMQRYNMKVPSQRVIIEVEDARKVLNDALVYFLKLEGRHLEWLLEYEEVANWLGGNRGRGLFLYGNCGRGKSLLVRYVLPAIILKYYRKVVNVYDIQEMYGDRILDRIKATTHRVLFKGESLRS